MSVTREECEAAINDPMSLSPHRIERLARAHLELLNKVIWRCFHCGFETEDRLQAAGHFGDCDDAEPICTLWESLSKDERIGLLQTSSGQYLEAQVEISAQNTKIEGLEYRLEGQLSEIHSFKPFRSCDTIHQVFNVYDSMEGRALAAEERNNELRSQKAALESQNGELREALKYKQRGMTFTESERNVELARQVALLESQLAEMSMQLPNKGERHSLQEQLAGAHHALKVCMDQLHSQTAGYKAARKIIDATGALRAKPEATPGSSDSASPEG